MLYTKVYQIGSILFLEEVGNPERRKIRSWNVDSTATHVLIQDLITDNKPLPAVEIPIADVRDYTNAAIGDQSRKAVEEWCAYPVA